MNDMNCEKARSPTIFLKPFIKTGDSIKNKVFQSLDES